MKQSFEQLIGLTTEDLELLKILNKTGAATAEEVALKLNRPGDDFTPQMQQLVKRNLIEVHPATVGDETFEVFVIDPALRKTFKV